MRMARMAKALIVLTMVAMIAGALVLPGPASAQTTSSSNWPNTAVIPMSSTQEPKLTTPVNSSDPPMGALVLQMTNNSDQIGYSLWVSNLANVTHAGIYMGAPGQQGAAIANLYPAANTTKVGVYSGSSANSTAMSGKFTGLLAKGTLMASNLVGPMAGKNITGLVSAVMGGQIYVNINTTQNPNGEVRGQINASNIWFSSLAVPLTPIDEPGLNHIPSSWNVHGANNVTNVSQLVGKNLGSIPWGITILHAGATELHYKIWVFNIENVTMAHFHMGGPGVNGSIVQWLYPSTTSMTPATPMTPGMMMNGKLVEGNVTNATVRWPAKGYDIGQPVRGHEERFDLCERSYHTEPQW